DLGAALLGKESALLARLGRLRRTALLGDVQRVLDQRGKALVGLLAILLLTSAPARHDSHHAIGGEPRRQPPPQPAALLTRDCPRVREVPEQFHPRRRRVDVLSARSSGPRGAVL